MFFLCDGWILEMTGCCAEDCLFYSPYEDIIFRAGCKLEIWFPFDMFRDFFCSVVLSEAFLL